MSSFFDDDGVYDTPFMLISGRQRIRAVAKLFSPLATESFEPTVGGFSEGGRGGSGVGWGPGR